MNASQLIRSGMSVDEGVPSVDDSWQLDGVDEYFVLPNNSDINFERTDTFSISFWVRLDIIAAQFLMNKLSLSSPFRGFTCFVEAGGTVRWELLSIVGDRLNMQSVSTLLTATWYNIVCTYNGSSTPAGMKMYINNVAESLTTLESTLTGTIAGGNDLGICGRNDGLLPVDGNFLDASIWKKELSVAEVNEIYSGGTVGDLLTHSAKADLVSYLRVDKSKRSEGKWKWADLIGKDVATGENLEVGDKVATIP